MSDEFTYYNSQTEQKTEFIFSNVQQNYIPDSNNSNYPNGQITWDLASLSNSGKYIDFQNSYVTIPLVMNLNITGTTAEDKENVFAASLKNGYHQLINSMSVEIANCQVVNLTNMSNLDIHYKLLTTSSIEDQNNFLPSINFAKDTAESVYYSDISNANGLGECNNIIKQSVFTAASGWGTTGWNSNKGRLDRQLNTSFDPINGANGSANNALVSEAGLKSVAKNYATTNAGATDVTHYILATIPLKIIHDLFKKLPLCKGMYMRLVMNLNTQCSCAATITESKFITYSTTSLNGVFSCMLSPIGVDSGFDNKSATKAVLSLGIGSSFGTTTSFKHPAMTSCRFYARVCEMTPQAEELYLSAVPTKTILCNDILSFSSFNNAANSTVSYILINGISHPRYLLIGT